METPNREQSTQAAAPVATLPLVIEIMPGQAQQGLVGAFMPDEYEGKSLAELVRSTMNSPNMTDEDRALLREVKQNMSNGKILYRGNDVPSGPAVKYAVERKTEAQEDILYIELRAIQPQEGGLIQKLNGYISSNNIYKEN